jgi:transcription elongation factor
MSIEEEIENLQKQLTNLNIQADKINKRITELKQSPKRTKSERVQIGDHVRILTPGRFKEREGIISKISQHRVTIETKSGKKIIRAEKNVKKTNRQR